MGGWERERERERKEGGWNGIMEEEWNETSQDVYTS
jgi:hypothetical protein